MKKVKIFCFIALLILTLSCSKEESDFASKIAGTYKGTVTVIGTGSSSGSSVLNKSSEKVVDLTIVIGSNNIPLNGINVKSDGNDSYDLSYYDASGSFDGKVESNKLTWTLEAGSIKETFSGTK